MLSDFEQLSLNEIIRLQNQLSSMLSRRFEHILALAFSDIVGSTAYFSRFGDEAGRRLQQQHLDLLQHALQPSQGRVVDTAGDGAFTCFDGAEGAVEAFTRFQCLLLQHNARANREHHVVTRTGIHWGPVLTDGTIVSGDAVNLCARLAGTAQPAEIRLTHAAFLQLPNHQRSRCHPRGPVPLTGIAHPVEVMEFAWRDQSRFPTSVLIEETQETIPLPNQPIITMGRLRELNGARANDIVIELPDSHMTQQISRWHVEVRRETEGLILRSVSNQSTEVNGKVLARGDEVPICIGDLIRLSRVMTLRFVSEKSSTATEGETLSHAL
jgi:class 3 adenylate cyclase